MTSQQAESLWNYSWQIYHRSGVTELCLALQDQNGLDVNLLLACCWAGANGVRLSREQVDELVGAGQPWQHQVVVPLRAVRRALKTFSSASAMALRQTVKANELEAERLQQEAMEASLCLPKGAPDRQAAMANLHLYAEHHGPTQREPPIARLTALAEAAF